MPRVPTIAPGGSGLLDRPGGSAILAAGQQEILGPVRIDVIIRAVVLVVSPAEADQDLVAPRPDAVVGRPARKPAWLRIDLDPLEDTRRLTGGAHSTNDGLYAHNAIHVQSKRSACS